MKILSIIFFRKDNSNKSVPLSAAVESEDDKGEHEVNKESTRCQVSFSY